MTEREAALEGPFRAALLAAEEDFVDLAQQDPRAQPRHGEDRPAAQHPAQRLREFEVGHGMGRGREQRTRQGLAIEGVENEADEVVAMDPAHPLPAVAEPASEA